MKEGFLQPNENQENERLLSDAEWVINSMWKKAMDINDLPLSVDSSYQAWTEDLKRRKNDFARVLFKDARESCYSKIDFQQLEMFFLSIDPTFY